VPLVRQREMSTTTVWMNAAAGAFDRVSQKGRSVAPNSWGCVTNRKNGLQKEPRAHWSRETPAGMPILFFGTSEHDAGLGHVYIDLVKRPRLSPERNIPDAE